MLISSFQFIKESTPSDHIAQDREPVFTQILHIFILAHDSGTKGPPPLVMVQTQQLSAIQPVSFLSYKEDTVKADFGPAFRGCMPATWGAVRSCCISTVKYEEKVFLKINLTGKSMKVFFFYETLNHSDAWSQDFMQFLFYHRKIFSNCGHSSYFNSFREGLLTP